QDQTDQTDQAVFNDEAAVETAVKQGLNQAGRDVKVEQQERASHQAGHQPEVEGRGELSHAETAQGSKQPDPGELSSGRPKEGRAKQRGAAPGPQRRQPNGEAAAVDLDEERKGDKIQGKGEGERSPAVLA